MHPFYKEKYEWYPSGSLKFTSHYGASYNLSKHTIYLENGAIKEEYLAQTPTQNSVIKSYYYSPEGVLLLINTYNSNNGITKQGLIKRELFYPSKKLKMVEILGTNYSIKYYNEDGTERIN
jgi:antitoxin component YwqK of YwqJK toxin-antitoxin module